MRKKKPTPGLKTKPSQATSAERVTFIPAVIKPASGPKPVAKPPALRPKSAERTRQGPRTIPLERLKAPDNPTAISPEKRFWHHVVESLHDPSSGRLDAARIADFYGLPLRRLALLLDRSPAAVAKTPAAPSLQAELGIFEGMAANLMLLASTVERARIWLNAPNPDLDNRSALDVILGGQAPVVAHFLTDIVNGQPG